MYVMHITRKMKTSSTIVLYLLVIIAYVQCDTNKNEEEFSITDFPETLIALGPAVTQNHTCSTIEFYNPIKDLWTILATIQLKVNDDYSAIATNGKLYIFGGVINHHNYFDEVMSFDLVTKEVKNLKPMNKKKGIVGLGVIDGNIYVSGGIGNDEIYNVVERYDPKTDSWTVLSPMLTKRYYHAVTVWDGKMYVAGGSGENFDILNSLEIYDPLLDSWTFGTPMNFSRYKFSIVGLDGSLFALGGNWTRDDANGERLDLNTHKWTDITNIINYKYWNTAVAFEDKIIISGNIFHNYQYKPKTNESKAISPNKISRISPILLLTKTT